eukprot:scaffold108433_cov48-Prasinocladus_malaysianus.AAC.1
MIKLLEDTARSQRPVDMASRKKRFLEGVHHTESMILDGYKAASDREAAVLRTAGKVVTDVDVISSFFAIVWRETRETSL